MKVIRSEKIDLLKEALDRALCDVAYSTRSDPGSVSLWLVLPEGDSYVAIYSTKKGGEMEGVMQDMMDNGVKPFYSLMERKRKAGGV